MKLHVCNLLIGERSSERYAVADSRQQIDVACKGSPQLP
jgi:hypothetical protein